MIPAARRRSRLALGLVVVLVTSFAGERVASSQSRASGSDDARRRAKELYDAGVKHYNVLEHDKAIAAFKEAYLLFPSAALLYNIAQSYRQKGASFCGEAADFYKGYLRERSDAPDRRDVEAKIAETEQCAAAQRQSESNQVAPRPAPGPGPAPVPVPAAPDAAGDPAKRSTLPLWIAGGGALLVLSGGVLYGTALAKHDAFEKECPCPADRWESWQTATYVSYGLLAGGAIIATGAVTWYFVQPRTAASKPTTAGVTITPWGIVAHGTMF